MLTRIATCDNNLHSREHAQESMPRAGHVGESAPQIAPCFWVDPTRDQVSCLAHTACDMARNGLYA